MDIKMLSHRGKLILSFLAIYFVWGSTFLFVKIALHSFPPFMLSAMRFLLGGIALITFASFSKQKFPTLNEVPKFIISGIVVFIGGVVAVVWAQQHISSSLASAIITTPFWFIVLDKKKWPFYFANGKILSGLILGLAGVILLMTQKQVVVTNSAVPLQLISILVMIAGSFLWVSGSLYLKEHPSSSSVYAATAIQLLSAGVFCCIITLLNGETSQFIFSEVAFGAWMSLFYLAIVSTTLTFLAFMWLIKVKPPVVVSTYAYVNPLVATLLGWTFANENISAIQGIALAIILIGVLFVNVGKSNLK